MNQRRTIRLTQKDPYDAHDRAHFHYIDAGTPLDVARLMNRRGKTAQCAMANVHNVAGLKFQCRSGHASEQLHSLTPLPGNKRWRCSPLSRSPTPRIKEGRCTMCALGSHLQYPLQSRPVYPNGICFVIQMAVAPISPSSPNIKQSRTLCTGP